MKKDDKIIFDKEYILSYTLFVVDTGEVLLTSKKKVNFLTKESFIDFGKLLVNNLHSKDSVSLNLSFRPVIHEPLIPFEF